MYQGNTAQTHEHSAPATSVLLFLNSTVISKYIPNGKTTLANVKFATLTATGSAQPESSMSSASKMYQPKG